jgi:hypothetical protein
LVSTISFESIALRIRIDVVVVAAIEVFVDVVSVVDEVAKVMDLELVVVVD